MPFTNICKHVNLGNAVITVLTNLIRRLSKNGRKENNESYCRQKCFCLSQQGLLWPSLLKQEPLFFTWMIQSIIRQCVFVFPPTKPFLSPLPNGNNQSYLVFFVQSPKRTDLIKKREIFWHLSLLLISKRGWGEKKKK